MRASSDENAVILLTQKGSVQIVRHSSGGFLFVVAGETPESVGMTLATAEETQEVLDWLAENL